MYKRRQLFISYFNYLHIFLCKWWQSTFSCIVVWITQCQSLDQNFSSLNFCVQFLLWLNVITWWLWNYCTHSRWFYHKLCEDQYLFLRAWLCKEVIILMTDYMETMVLITDHIDMVLMTCHMKTLMWDKWKTMVHRTDTLSVDTPKWILASDKLNSLVVHHNNILYRNNFAHNQE